jgi:uncharacterized protein (DUF362 family)
MTHFAGKMKKNRREFFKAGLGAYLSLPTYLRMAQASPAKSRVVIARDDGPSHGSKISEAKLIQILDRSVQALYQRDNPLDAWKLVAKPGQVVGLKVNCLAGKGISTNFELVEAISERLQQIGAEVVVWDRLNRDLERAGYSIQEKGRGPRCFGNDHLGFGQQLETHNLVGSLVCRTLTELCDVVINVPVLKDHGITGVTMAMKNMFGAIHNPNKYHLNVGDPYVPDVYMLKPIREKVVLTICDAIQAQYEGGPSYMPHWTWPYKGLIVGVDPVALDFTGWQILDKKRKEVGMPVLGEVGRQPTYIATAADSNHNLGTNDPNRIELLEV